MKNKLLISILTLSSLSFAETPQLPTFPEEIHGHWKSLEGGSKLEKGIKVNENQFQYFTVSEDVSYASPYKITGGTSEKFMVSNGSQRFAKKYSLNADTLTVASQAFYMGAGGPQTHKYIKASSEPKSEFSILSQREWPKKISNDKASLTRKKSGFYFTLTDDGMTIAYGTKKPLKFKDGVSFWKLSKCQFPFGGCKKYVAAKLYKHSKEDNYTFDVSLPHDTMEGALDLLNRSNGTTMRDLKTTK